MTVCVAVRCPWNQTLLHTFTGAPNDGTALYGGLIFDQAGNIYGTTTQGGTFNDGVAFELTSSGGQWTQNILHSFGSGSDGLYPYAGLVLDNAGNLYGTTSRGGSATCGTVFQLAPSSGSWIENIILDLGSQQGEILGCLPFGTLIIDHSGNLYGTTSITAGLGPGGSIFKLAASNGGWIAYPLYDLPNGCNPQAGVTMDSAGNLYGVCFGAAQYGFGMVFKLTNSPSGWMLTDLHDFTGVNDGSHPYGPVVFANNNLYGTTRQGGDLSDCSGNGCGVVWEIAGAGNGH